MLCLAGGQQALCLGCYLAKWESGYVPASERSYAGALPALPAHATQHMADTQVVFLFSGRVVLQGLGES